MAKSNHNEIVFQGEPGANSHLACLHAFPDMNPIACRTFEDAIAAVHSGAARYAMIPIENSVSGRVADIHHLLPESRLVIVGEHFERIRHQLLALPEARMEDLKTVHSHAMALGQCRVTMRKLGERPNKRIAVVSVSSHARGGEALARGPTNDHVRFRDAAVLRDLLPHNVVAKVRLAGFDRCLVMI